MVTTFLVVDGVPDLSLNTVPARSHLSAAVTLAGTHYYSHFTDEDTELR